MKKLPLILVMIMMLILAACGDDSEEAATTDEVENENVANEEVSGEENENNDELDVEEEPEVSLNQVVEEVTLDAFDHTIYESDEGVAKIIGTYMNEAQTILAVKLEGDLQGIATRFDPKFRVITDSGNAHEKYELETRFAEDAAYVLFTFSGAGGKKIERIDYSFDNSEDVDEEKEPEKIIVGDEEEKEEEVVIPGIAHYTSHLDEPIALEDAEKAIDINKMNYDSSTGQLDIVMDVTSKSDEEIEDTSYVYDYRTRTESTKTINGEFFEGVAKEVSVSYSPGALSEHTPYVKLVIFDNVLNLNLFADEAAANAIELVENDEESLANQLPYDEHGGLNTTYIATPGLPPLMKDAANKEYYDYSFSIEGGANAVYYEYDQYNFGYYRFLTDDYNQFEAKLSFREVEENVGDVTIYFIGDDFEEDSVDESLKQFKGKVLEEVKVKADGKPVEVSVDIEDTSILTMYTVSDSTGIFTNPSEVIISNSKLKK